MRKEIAAKESINVPNLHTSIIQIIDDRIWMIVLCLREEVRRVRWRVRALGGSDVVDDDVDHDVHVACVQRGDEAFEVVRGAEFVVELGDAECMEGEGEDGQ